MLDQIFMLLPRLITTTEVVVLNVEMWTTGIQLIIKAMYSYRNYCSPYSYDRLGMRR